MLKKYLPLIIVLIAAAALYFIKKNQRGSFPQHHETEQTLENNKDIIDPVDTATFSRNVNHIIYSKHARCRMGCRHIDETEVKEILAKGKVNYNKIESDERGPTYPLEGTTHDNQRVRIVFAPKGEAVEVVTCIDLDTEWPCNCK